MVVSGGLQAMLQAAIVDGVSFDPFSFCLEGRAASEVDVGRGEIVDALGVSAVDVVGDVGLDLGFGVAWQTVVFPLDAGREGVVPGFVPAPCSGIVRDTTDFSDF